MIEANEVIRNASGVSDASKGSDPVIEKNEGSHGSAGNTQELESGWSQQRICLII
jgi:hypothetical protein